jgi:hypothetical protein
MTRIPRTFPEGYTQIPEIKHLLKGHEEEGYGGLTRISALTANQAESLLALLPEDCREDAQNDSPTATQMVALARRWSGSHIYGYRVHDERPDERITFEEMRIPWDALTKEDLLELTYLFPDEMDLTSDNYLRLWWD